jgi:hypothetical protein
MKRTYARLTAALSGSERGVSDGIGGEDDGQSKHRREEGKKERGGEGGG